MPPPADAVPEAPQDAPLLPLAQAPQPPLQVLLWTDDDRFAQQALGPLREAGFDIAHERVSRPETYAAALRARDWHLVLFDEAAGRSHSLLALRMLRTSAGQAAQTPFILAATFVNTAAVLETVRAGASDCIPRHDPARLVQAVARELAAAERLAEQRAARRESEEREARARRAGQMLPHALYVCDAQGRITFFNRTAELLWGRTPAEGIDFWCGSWRMRHPDGRPVPAEESPMALAIRERRIATEVELVIERPDQTLRFVRASAQPVFDEGGHFAGAVCMLVDVTEQRAQLQQLRLAQQVFAQAREAAVIMDGQRRVVMVNQAFTDISGYAADEILGRTTALLNSERQDEAYYRGIWTKVDAEGQWQGEVWNRLKDGSDRPAWLKATAVRDVSGAITNYVGTFQDIGEQKAASERIQRLSYFDALTGLANRSLLADRCARDLHRARRAGGTLAMLVLGIDDFMTVNDAQGHAVGNQLLQLFARRIEGMLRREDTLARLGGDEFVLLLPGLSPDQAGLMAARLNHAIAQPFRVQEADICITASIGVALYSRDGLDFDSLFKSAELALHQAKKQQRGGFRFFSPEMYESTVAKVALVAGLRGALALQETAERPLVPGALAVPGAADDQFQLHYQPFADLETGRIAGMEALLRWRHPTLGPVSPADFIPVAEQSGLIVAIGAWVIRQACRDMRSWLDEGLAVPMVAVNLSPLQLRDAGLLRHIEATLAEFHIEPARLCIEVTESALMDDVAHSESVLRALKQLGVHLSLDDFGTGYSSLSYLKLFDFDKVKLDQSFVHGLGDNAQDEVIAKVVISMAHGLGLRVVAEGVETEPQCEFLRANHCDMMQGYLFSRPLPAARLRELLAQGPELPRHLLLERQRERCVLVVDPDTHIAEELAEVFTGQAAVRHESDTQAALERMAQSPMDVVMVNCVAPGSDGLALLARARTVDPACVRAALVDTREREDLQRAIVDGTVDRVLVLPWSPHLLRARLQDAFQFRDLQAENEQLRRKIRGANLELATSNRRLQDLVRQKQEKIEQRELSLKMLREALQFMPVPVLGVDDEGLLAFVNEQALAQLAPGRIQLGAALRHSLPALAEWLERVDPGEPEAEILLEGRRWRLGQHAMGGQSTAQGRVLTLTPLDRSQAP